jgi:hypothetical protein
MGSMGRQSPRPFQTARASRKIFRDEVFATRPEAMPWDRRAVGGSGWEWGHDGAPDVRRPAAGDQFLPHSRASFGCVGNRVYTGADDTEGYSAIPGLMPSAVETHLAVIIRANQELEKFHRTRALAIS